MMRQTAAPEHDGVRSSETIFADIDRLRAILFVVSIQVRVNSWNPQSFFEINDVISRGAQVVMHPLLGGLGTRAFLQRHWQRKPLLIRRAFADFAKKARASIPGQSNK
jgi:hypothetical protein